jgi:GDP-L-fucose synthase
MPALIRKFHEAKLKDLRSVSVWGTGTPRREFLHVDDCADACLFLMNHYEGADIVNIGMGKDISIRELAQLVKSVVEYPGDIVFDSSKPDGTPRKLVDPSRLFDLGWRLGVSLEQGVRATYEWYRKAHTTRS